MDAADFMGELGADFYVGVPDSQLKALCDCLMAAYGVDAAHHVIAANEGNAVGLAAGYHLATGKVPVVYMQNSGQGNAVNPIASLLDDEVYGIPAIFVIGWRGEPGVPDEPQHAFQGQITLQLLEDLGIGACVLSADVTRQDVAEAMERFRPALTAGKSVAFVVRKGALSFDGSVAYGNEWSMRREDAIARVLAAAGDDPVVSTTGKPSREVFELREAAGQSHGRDFLTVGSMGHASSIALGIAAQRPGARVWCLDGDGAALMHMGALATIGSSGARNLVHVVLDNGAHETVGGMPTAAGQVDLAAVARACGYATACYACDEASFDRALAEAVATEGPSMVVARCALGSRSDLGRPTITPKQAKVDFMEHLSRL